MVGLLRGVKLSASCVFECLERENRQVQHRAGLGTLTRMFHDGCKRHVKVKRRQKKSQKQLY